MAISCAGPKSEIRVGFVVQTASPVVVFPVDLAASAFAVANARLTLEVNKSGTLACGIGVAAPAENEEAHGSLLPGTNMKVVV